VFSRRGFAIFTLFTLSCGRQHAPETERIAFVRFENLGPEVSADWAGPAFAEILKTELAGASGIYVIGGRSERSAALAAGANRIGYGWYAMRGGRVETTLAIEDPATNRMRQVLSASTGDVISAASAIAHQISPAAAPFGTASEAALKAWALGQPEEAIAADPSFGPPYRLLAERRAQAGDRRGAIAVLGQALAHADRMAPADRVRIEYEAASLREDPGAQKRALEALVQIAPRDTGAWQALAQSCESRRDFAGAIAVYRKLLELDESDANAWNRLGYAAAYAGDLDSAMAAIRRYEKLRPADADPLDSLGDVNLVAGKLREAEEFYLQAAKKDPRSPASPELFKAAMARLMTGDVAGATRISDQLADARAAAQDPQAEVYRVEWMWLTGQRKAAYEKLESLASADTSLRSYGELAMWSLMLGDRAKAAEMARKAAAVPIAAVPLVLSQPPAPPLEWANRIERAFPGPQAASLRNVTLAYALLLDRQFAPAALLLERLYQMSGLGRDDEARIELAWAYLESGRARDAEPLLKWNPIPPIAGPGPLLSFYFPRLYYLRKDYRLFLQLSGGDAFQWGEEARASSAGGR